MEVAKPTIADVFEAFLEETDNPSRERPFTDRRAVAELLVDYLDGYAYQDLDKAEDVFWRARFEEDEEGGSFCRTFGPEKVPPNISMFLGWFMIRKVLGPRELMKAAGPVVSELLDWLTSHGYISAEAAADAIERADEAKDELPRADELGSILYDVMKEDPSGSFVEDLDLCDEVVTISRVERGKLWFDHPDGIEVGPLRVPERASKIAVVGWEVSATHFVRTRKGWHLIEMGNVYPR
jgi:hypothetical protein